jgi:hypothetical protein
MKKNFRRTPLFVGLITLGFFLGGIFLARPEHAFACSGTGIIKIANDKTSYGVNEKFDGTVFFDSDGSCSGKAIRIDFEYIENGTQKVLYSINCPHDDNGNGIFCAINGQKYQFHFVGTPFTQLSPGQYNLQAQIYTDGVLALKVPPVQVTINQTTSGANQTTESVVPKPIETRLTVAINGLTQTGNLALYLSTIYTYGLQIVGMFAVFMIILGGIKYLTAGGDQGRTKSAIENITNATIGLVLALATYLILNTINPELLKFKAISPPPITRAVIQSANWCEDLDARYTVDPAIGSCGSQGRVSATQAGTKVVNDSCDFKKCTDANKTCSKNPLSNNKFECHSCDEYDLDKLEKISLGAFSLASISDATCANLGGKNCVFVSDKALGIRQGCAKIAVPSCTNVHKCEDYAREAKLFVSSETEDVRYERECWPPQATTMTGFLRLCLSAKPSPHLAGLCGEDPCGVAKTTGGCEWRGNDKFIEEIKNRTIPIEFDIFGATQLSACCPKGQDCGDFTPKKPKEKECVGNKC